MKHVAPCLAALAVALAAGCATRGPKPVFEHPYDLNRPDCRIGVLAGCDSEYLSRRLYNKAEVVAFDQPQDIIMQLLTEKLDGVVYDEHVLRLAQWHYPDRFRILEQPIDTDPSVIAVSPRRPELRDAFNRFIASYRKNGLYDEMFLRWCHDPERRPEDVPEISSLLCKAPDAKPLRIGIDPAQEPNAYITPKGRLAGFDVEFSLRFGRAEKYLVSFVQDEEKALFKMLEAGEIDAVVANLAREPFRKGVLWTDGYLDADIMVMVKERDE